MAISEFRQRKYSALFAHLDNNDDGVIDETDWQRYAEVIRKEKDWSEDEPLLHSLTQAADGWWQAMRDVFGDAAASGISLEQFSDFCDQTAMAIADGAVPPHWAYDFCNSMHQTLDVSADGTVCADEYGLWLRAIGSKADAQDVFKKIDLNGDGVVDQDEMIELFKQFMCSEDPAEPGNYIMTGEF